MKYRWKCARHRLVCVLLALSIASYSFIQFFNCFFYFQLDWTFFIVTLNEQFSAFPFPRFLIRSNEKGKQLFFYPSPFPCLQQQTFLQNSELYVKWRHVNRKHCYCTVMQLTIVLMWKWLSPLLGLMIMLQRTENVFRIWKEKVWCSLCEQNGKWNRDWLSEKNKDVVLLMASFLFGESVQHPSRQKIFKWNFVKWTKWKVPAYNCSPKNQIPGCQPV